jgi:hypothetical protein
MDAGVEICIIAQHQTDRQDERQVCTIPRPPVMYPSSRLRPLLLLLAAPALFLAACDGGGGGAAGFIAAHLGFWVDSSSELRLGDKGRALIVMDAQQEQFTPSPGAGQPDTISYSGATLTAQGDMPGSADNGTLDHKEVFATGGTTIQFFSDGWGILAQGGPAIGIYWSLALDGVTLRIEWGIPGEGSSTDDGIELRMDAIAEMPCVLDSGELDFGFRTFVPLGNNPDSLIGGSPWEAEGDAFTFGLPFDLAMVTPRTIGPDPDTYLTVLTFSKTTLTIDMLESSPSSAEPYDHGERVVFWWEPGDQPGMIDLGLCYSFIVNLGTALPVTGEFCYCDQGYFTFIIVGPGPTYTLQYDEKAFTKGSVGVAGTWTRSGDPNETLVFAQDGSWTHTVPAGDMTTGAWQRDDDGRVFINPVREKTRIDD